jgi:hypothetical protein
MRQTVPLLILLAFLASCSGLIEKADTMHVAGSAAATSLRSPVLPAVDALVATGHQSIPSNYASTINAVTQNATQIQQLFDYISSLSEINMGATFHCPIDWGYTISLTFTDQGKTVLTGTVDVSGCRFLSLNNGHEYSTDDMFWTLLEKSIGQSIPYPNDLLSFANPIS